MRVVNVGCIALLSGGLDSMLAVRIMQEQGVRVEAVNFQTQFTCCQDVSGEAAHELGVRLTVLSAQDDYLDVIRRPEFGYGRGANPCVDCRIYMFRKAKLLMAELECQFVVSGEVLGQRPNSQKRRDLDIISHHAGLEDLLLRPLSAHLLAPTLPEREGWVDRRKLYRFCGRGRKPLIQLAQQLGLKTIPDPSTGCALTDKRFSHKVHDLIQLDTDSTKWDFELLKTGRHYRIDSQHKVVVGRNEDDNARLQYMQQLEHTTASALLEPDGFIGPAALLVGTCQERSLQEAGALLLRHAKVAGDAPVSVRVTTSSGVSSLTVSRITALDQLEPITAK
jgi:tRNA U34 2-thiouridine synthase MnmA/TrmU